jgi:hypothetical protein
MAHITLMRAQSVVAKADGRWINGAPESEENQLRQVGNLEKISGETKCKPAAFPFLKFLAAITDKDTTVRTWKTPASQMMQERK